MKAFDEIHIIRATNSGYSGSNYSRGPWEVIRGSAIPAQRSMGVLGPPLPLDEPWVRTSAREARPNWPNARHGCHDGTKFLLGFGQEDVGWFTHRGEQYFVWRTLSLPPAAFSITFTRWNCFWLIVTILTGWQGLGDIIFIFAASTCLRIWTLDWQHFKAARI